MEHATIIGIDLAKRSFQLHGARADGSVAFRKKLSRKRLLAFVASQPRCIVAMEACASAHHWGREIGKLGHAVKLVPPIYVKPFVKRQKNDAADDALRGGEVAGPAVARHALPPARSAGPPAHADDQRAARPLRGVRRRGSARAGTGQAAGGGN